MLSLQIGLFALFSVTMFLGFIHIAGIRLTWLQENIHPVPLYGIGIPLYIGALVVIYSDISDCGLRDVSLFIWVFVSWVLAYTMAILRLAAK